MGTTDKSLFNLREILVRRFSLDELRVMAYDLGVHDYIPWDGSLNQVAINFIAYMERQGKIQDLLELMKQARPDLADEIKFDYKAGKPSDEIVNLSLEIASIRQQLLEFQKNPPSKEAIDERVKSVIEVAEKASNRSDELTARLVLPSSSLTDVPLIPVHTLDRLEEYRSDENIAHLLIGLFGGSTLGILSNWATDENFTMPRFSIVLIILFIALTIACIIWARRIDNRAKTIKAKMISRE